MAVEPEAPSAPSRIGRFEIVRPLGAGGMGVVYLAVDAELDRKVAIKVLADRRLSTSDRVRMQREAQALARISHPNVVQVYEVGRHDDVLFVAMEYLDGRTLRAWLGDTRTWEQTVDVFAQAGRGLAAAHRVGLVHRDFKPENAMFGGDGRVRVLDFGLARLDALHADEPSSSGDASPSSSSRALHVDITRTGASVGTPAYMAPEQFLGTALDARTDQFSFCVALFEALYGQRPFGGRTRLQLAAAVTRGVIDVPPGARVPPRIRKAVLRGLAVEPGDRFADLDELVTTLVTPSRVGRNAAIVAVAAGALALAFVRTSEGGSPCDGVAAAIDDTWGTTQREQVRTAFASVRAPYAEDNLVGVEQSIDGYVERWRAARVDACTATRVTATQSPELMDLRMACLDGRQRRLAATIDLLDDGDREIVQRSITMVDALPSVERCADPGYVRLSVPRPDDAASAATLAHIDQELAAVDALTNIVRFDEAAARAAPAVASARALGYEPALAGALIALGRAQSATGDFTDADATLEEAYLLALRSEDSATAFEAAMELADSFGDFQDKYAEARTWLDFAGAFAAHASADPFDRVWVEQKRGEILRDEGQAGAAIPILESALEAGTELLPPDDLRLAQIHRSLGKAYEHRDRFDDAQREYERDLAIVRGKFGEHHPKTAHAIFELGTLAINRGHYEEALSWYRRADAVFAESLEPQAPIRAALMHNIADALGRLGRDEEAIVEQQRALDSFVKIYGEEHTNVAFALNNLGTMHRRLGDDDQALAALERSLVIRKKIFPADHPEIGLVLGNIALVLQNLRRFEEARVHQEKALELARKELGDEHTLVATHLQNLGNTLDELGAFEQAEARFLEARAIWTRLGVADHPDAASADQGLSYVYRRQGRLDEALAAIERAVEIRRSLGEDHALLAGDLHELARVRLARGEPREAALAMRRVLAIPPAADGYSRERTIAGRKLDLARALLGLPDGAAEAKTLLAQARVVFVNERNDAKVREVDALLR